MYYMLFVSLEFLNVWNYEDYVGRDIRKGGGEICSNLVRQNEWRITILPKKIPVILLKKTNKIPILMAY